MKAPENIATPEEILVQLETKEFPALLRDMTDYATNAIIDKNREMAKDLASDLIFKYIRGIRKWNKELTFRESLFGSLQSDVFNYNRKLKRGRMKEVEEEDVISLEEDDPHEKLGNAELKALALKTLKAHNPPPTTLEELLFESKMEGMIRSIEIAEFLGVDVKEIYKAEKRLERKMDAVRVLFKSMGYE